MDQDGEEVTCGQRTKAIFMGKGFASALLILVASSASAGYIENKVQWDRLSLDTKRGYVMGLYDEQVTLIIGLERLNAYRQDLSACVVSLELYAGQLVDLVETEYQDLTNWELPAMVMAERGLRKVCLAHMNRARAARGDELLDR